MCCCSKLCCCRALVFLVALLELITFLGAIGVQGFFCYDGFHFKGPRANLSCKDYVFLFLPLLLFLAVVTIYGIVALFLSTNQTTCEQKPKKSLHLVKTYMMITIPILLLELSFSLASLDTRWYSLRVMLSVLALAGKNFLFVLLVWPYYTKLDRIINPRLPKKKKPKLTPVQRNIEKKKRCIPLFTTPTPNPVATYTSSYIYQAKASPSRRYFAT